MIRDSLCTTPAILPSGVCTLRGRLCPSTMENFPSAATYERNGQQQIRFQTDCVDGKGTLKYVTVWDTAARQLLQVNGTSLSQLWEACEEGDGTVAFLEPMRVFKDKEYVFLLEVAIREWKGKHSYQISMSSATEAEAL